MKTKNRPEKRQNVVGPQVRKLRYQQGLTQDMLAARCSVQGLELSRGTLAKIEAKLRCVSDSELLVLAQVLGVKLESLFPPSVKASSISNKT